MPVGGRFFFRAKQKKMEKQSGRADDCRSLFGSYKAKPKPPPDKLSDVSIVETPISASSALVQFRQQTEEEEPPRQMLVSSRFVGCFFLLTCF